MEKLFYGIEMTWKRVLIGAVAVAAITALLNCIPALKGTSFTAPATYPELWLILGLIVACNCQTTKEAMAKVFVFFLVSQPLFYLFEVPFKAAGFGLYAYYPYWFMATLLTVPAAALAFQIKRQNIFSAIIVGIAAASLAYMGSFYCENIVNTFPRMTLAILFCFGSAVFLILALMSESKKRIIAAVAGALVFAVMMGYNFVTANSEQVSGYVIADGHTWEVASQGDESATIEIANGDIIRVTHSTEDQFNIELVNENGEHLTLHAARNSEGALDIEPVD